MNDGKKKLGLIAGNGQFPFRVLQSAKEQKIPVIVAAIKDETFPEIETCGYPVYWLGLGELGKLIRLFLKEGVQKAMMAGQVKHVKIFGSAFPDLTMMRMLAGLKSRNTDSLIGGVTRVLEESGITVVDSTVMLQPNMAPEGILTRRGLNPLEAEDLEYGRPIAHKIASMDIGQAIAVRDKAVVAVEAMEGTDSVIQRAGVLANRNGVTIIKVSKPNQDMRFDIPVVGLPTIQAMIESGATALAIDAGKTIIFDREEMIALANENNIAIVSLPPIQ